MQLPVHPSGSQLLQHTLLESPKTSPNTPFGLASLVQCFQLQVPAHHSGSQLLQLTLLESPKTGAFTPLGLASLIQCFQLQISVQWESAAPAHTAGVIKNRCLYAAWLGKPHTMLSAANFSTVGVSCSSSHCWSHNKQVPLRRLAWQASYNVSAAKSQYTVVLIPTTATLGSKQVH
jgi:hypothetical protein